MIEILDVDVTQPINKILKNINLTINEQRVGIIGANGSGKSTLVKLIKGLIKPSKGKILIHGMDVNNKIVKSKIGYVFQDPDNQIIMPIVEDDIGFGLKNSGLNKSEIRTKVEHVLKRYRLEKLLGKTTYHLSGGEKQLVAIAGVLVMNPEIIIFDEPTTLLDLRNKNHIQSLMNQLNQPILLVTHDLYLLEKFDRVIVLDGGEIIADNIPEVAIKFYVESMSKTI